MNDEPILPKGWTYLRHGSSIDRWDNNVIGHNFIVGLIKGNLSQDKPLCCIERKDAILDYNMRGFDFAAAFGGIIDNFEIRVLFFEDVLRGKSQHSNYVKSLLDEEELKDIKAYYSFQDYRHPAVPVATKLVYLSTTYYNEITNEQDHPIFWYIPKKYLKHYKNDLLNSDHYLKNLDKSRIEEFKTLKA
jgi:hypothetical protein